MSRKPLRNEEFSLGKVQLLNWALLLVLTATGWVAWSGQVAQAIAVGGLIANVSFMFLKKDLFRLLSGPLQAAKVRFFLKYYARFAVVVLVLFWLVKFQHIHTVGLLVGLSTVLLSIIFTVISEAKKVYFNLKEAA